jgi:predicted amidohydrolase
MNSTISLVQMVSSQSVESSLRDAEGLILEAARCQPWAIFLPENFAALGARYPREIGEREAGQAGPIRRFVSDMATKTGCWIFAGTLPMVTREDGTPVSDGRVRAASLVVNEHGEEIARYDKIHMFDVDVDDGHKHYMESATFEPGTTVVSVESPIGKLGLTVCYDIRFPELYQRLFAQGVMGFTVPSAFTEPTGKAHFELLMRARAVESSCFVISACQGGEHDSGRRTWGHSMVVDPWGEVLGELELGEGVLSVTLDLEMQSRLRADMPLLSQRRLT